MAGPSEQAQACLEKAYDRLVACCYDLSSKSQIEKKQTYNFYYDSAKDCFVSFPKSDNGLLYDKQAVPAGDKVGWGAGPKTGKRKPGGIARFTFPPAIASGRISEHTQSQGGPGLWNVGGRRGSEVRPKDGV